MFRLPPLTPFVKKLLIGLLGAFVAQLVLEVWLGVPVSTLLALSTETVGVPTLWQLFTYVLVWPPSPSSVAWLLISLLFFWWMMAPFEQRHGAARTAQLCLVSTLSASVPALLAGLLWPSYPLFGSNVILIGVIGAFAASMPRDATISLFGLFPMRPVHLILLVIGWSLLGFLASKNLSGFVADLGALGGGMAFMRFLMRPRRPKAPRPPKKNGRSRRSHGFRVIEGGGESSEDDDVPPRILH